MKIQKICRLLCFVVLMTACRQQPELRTAAAPAASASITVAMLPYNDFDTALIPFVKREIQSFYNCNVTVLPETNLPGAAFYLPRQRYKADSLLVFQKNSVKTADIVVGLTDKDISTTVGTVSDWGVFGLGYKPGRACVISLYRLKKTSSSLPQLKERLAKVVLHELGHNLGLPHCTNNITCLMNDAGGTITQVDRERKWFCGKCKKLLAGK